MTRRPSCADAARARGDQLAGTAGPATSWVLLENVDGWPATVAAHPVFAAPGGATLVAAANRHQTRLLLVRRPGRRRHGDQSPHIVAVYHQGLGIAWSRIWHGDDDLAETAAVVLGLAEGTLTSPPDGWQAHDESALLVCTHSQHDTCCAVRGRPVAAELARRWPDATWECSHLGGDRFAGNLLIVPDGALYGGLDGDSAVGCVAAHVADEAVAVDHLRGVGGLSAAANVALTEVLRTHRQLGLTQVSTGTPRHLGPDHWQVDVDVPSLGRYYLVDVRVTSAEPALLTCHAAHAAPPLAYTASLQARPR